MEQEQMLSFHPAIPTGKTSGSGQQAAKPTLVIGLDVFLQQTL